jgi:hypothetical protein
MMEGQEKTRAQEARELGVARPTVHQAEEMPKKGLFVLRKRIIEAYSNYKISGSVFVVEER